MKATRTYQFRLYTTKAGCERIDDVLGQCQRLYNAALEERKTAWKGHGIGVSFKDQSAQLTLIRKHDPDGYGGFNRRLAVGALDRLHNAFQAFFRRVKAGETPGYPRFKAYARWRTLDPKGIEKAWFKGDHLKINGLPIMCLKRGRAFP